MEFPRLVFKCPGDMPRKGGTFKVLQVADDASHDESLAGGWFATLPEAIDAHDNPRTVEAPEPVKADEVSTRAELEEKARALDLKFDGRTSDAKLAKMIAEA